jgi:hypothetical protein
MYLGLPGSGAENFIGETGRLWNNPPRALFAIPVSRRASNLVEESMILKNFFPRLVVSAAAVAFLPGAALALDASSVLKRASSTMGGAELKSIAYTADGWGYTFGQAYVPTAPWPKIQIHSLARSINYDTASMRDLITYSRAEPRGGGGYPLTGQVTNDRFVSGGFAWNVAGGNPASSPRDVSDRIHDLWVSPHGVLKAAIRNNATLDFRTVNGKSLAASRPPPTSMKPSWSSAWNPASPMRSLAKRMWSRPIRPIATSTASCSPP